LRGNDDSDMFKIYVTISVMHNVFHS
jgi:hypothetical protein